MGAGYDHFENIFYEAGTLEGTSTAKVYLDQVYEGRSDGYPARMNIRKGIYALFQAENLKVDEDILMRFLKHQVKDENPKTFSIPSGLYKVTRIIPDGPKTKVYCINQQGTEIFFYQGFYDDKSMLHNDVKKSESR